MMRRPLAAEPALGSYATCVQWPSAALHDARRALTHCSLFRLIRVQIDSCDRARPARLVSMAHRHQLAGGSIHVDTRHSGQILGNSRHLRGYLCCTGSCTSTRSGHETCATVGRARRRRNVPHQRYDQQQSTGVHYGPKVRSRHLRAATSSAVPGKPRRPAFSAHVGRAVHGDAHWRGRRPRSSLLVRFSADHRCTVDPNGE